MRLVRELEKKFNIKITKIENNLLVYDNKVFDSLYSIFFYLNAVDEYEFFIGRFPHIVEEMSKEIIKYKKYEEALLKVDDIFFNIPNLKKSPTEQDTYFFSKPTTFTIDKTKYNVKKYARVIILKNFANQKVGIIITRAHKESPVFSYLSGLWYKPYYIYKADEVRKIFLAVRDDYKMQFKDYHRIVFLKEHFPYLKYFLNEHKDTDFEIKFSFPQIPKPTFLFQFYELRAILFRDYPFYKTNVYEWIKSYKYSKTDAQDMYRYLRSLKAINEIHPEFVHLFTDLKKTIYGKSSFKRMKRGIHETQWNVHEYIMNSSFKFFREKSCLVAKCRDTGIKFIFKDSITLEDSKKIEAHLNKLNTFDRFRKLDIISAAQQRRKAIRLILEDKYNAFSEYDLEFKDNRWAIKALNAKATIRTGLRKIVLNTSAKGDTDLSIKTNVISRNRNVPIFFYRAGLRAFNSNSSNHPNTIEKRLTIMRFIIDNFPIFYLMRQKIPIRIFCDYEETKDELIKILQFNAWFNVEREEVIKTLSFTKSHANRELHLAIGPKEFRKRLKNINKGKFLESMRISQIDHLRYFLIKCKDYDCLRKSIQTRIRSIKEIIGAKNTTK